MEETQFNLFAYDFDSNGKNDIKKIEITNLKSSISKYCINKYFIPLILSPTGHLIICNNSHYKFYNFIKKDLPISCESTYDVYTNLWNNRYVTIDISFDNLGKMNNIYYASDKIFKTQYNILELLAIYLECNLFKINHAKLYEDGNFEEEGFAKNADGSIENGLMGGNRLNLQNKYIIRDSCVILKYKPPNINHF